MFILVIIIWVGLSYLVGKLAEDRIIGFAGAFVISLITSPVVGLIVLAFSPDRKQNSERVYDKQQEVVNSMKANQIAEQIVKLKNMKDDGLITDIEFEMLKYKLLNDQ